MGHPMKIPGALLLSLSLSLAFTACEELDFTGMFLSDQTANQRFKQSMEWNRMHPFREISVPSDDYFILSMGDSHSGGTENLDTFINRGRILKATALVMVGDLTTGHAEDYAVFQQHLPPQDTIPSFLLVGNHELYFDGWEQFYSRFGSSTYLFTIKTPAATDLYICLDSGGGTLGSEQMDWLKGILADLRPDYRHCVVFTHNNLFRPRHTVSTNPPVEELHVLVELFTIHRVDLVITGHDHKKDVQWFGNTAYITMDALMDGLSYAGYLQLHFNNGQVDYTFINL
jgi:hypothetical protein